MRYQQPYTLRFEGVFHVVPGRGRYAYAGWRAEDVHQSVNV
jgi:hypothetical protein